MKETQHRDSWRLNVFICTSSEIKRTLNNNSLHRHFSFHCLTVTDDAKFLFLTDLPAEGNATAGTVQLVCK